METYLSSNLAGIRLASKIYGTVFKGKYPIQNVKRNQTETFSFQLLFVVMIHL